MGARFAAAGGDTIKQDKLGSIEIKIRVRQVAKRSGDCRQVVCLCEDILSAANAAREVADTQPEMETKRALTDDEGGLSSDISPVPPPRKPPSRNLQIDPLQAVGQLPLSQQIDPLLTHQCAGRGHAVPGCVHALQG